MNGNMPVTENQEFPQVFGRYLLLRRLSRGGMGEVYLAKTGQIAGFEKIVVIKRILPHLSSNKDFSRRFITEANIAIKLSHNNIVPVLEVGKVAGEFFLALDHVEGRDLRSIQAASYKKQTNLPVYLSLLIVRDMLTGLSYAHRREDELGRHLKIVHCDVSPPNILVSYEGEVKVIDFGIAKSVIETETEGEDGASKIGFGKLGYMAPEQIIKGEPIDPRTDIYSAGVVLWELLTGRKMIMFDENTPYKDIAKKVVLEMPPKPSSLVGGLDASIDRLVFKAIAKKPEDRYQTAAEFRDAVQLALVKIAPTVTNESLGKFLLNLFDTDIKRERELMVKMREVDISSYISEMTSAIEETISFAIGDDYQDFTGPLHGQNHEPANTDPSPPPPAALAAATSQVAPVPYRTPTERVEGERIDYPASKKYLLPFIIAVSISAAVGFWFMSRKTDTTPIDLASNFSEEKIKELNKPLVIKVERKPKKDKHKRNKHKTSSKTHKTRKTMSVRRKNSVRTYHPMRYTMRSVMKTSRMAAPQPMIPAVNIAAERKRLTRKYMYIRRKYRKFESANGKILYSKWMKLRNYMMLANKSDPNVLKKLEIKLDYFNQLIDKHSK